MVTPSTVAPATQGVQNPVVDLTNPVAAPTGLPSADTALLRTIGELAHEQRELRTLQPSAGPELAALVARLAELEDQIEQAWDLLRQRRALRAAGANPETASLRPARQVRSYRQ